MIIIFMKQELLVREATGDYTGGRFPKKNKKLIKGKYEKIDNCERSETIGFGTLFSLATPLKRKC